MPSESSTTSEPAQQNKKKAEPHVSPPKTMTCPKCGFEQKKAPKCRKCGIFIQNYLKIQQQKAAAEAVDAPLEMVQKFEKKIEGAKKPLHRDMI